MVSVRRAKQGKSWKTVLLQNSLLGKQRQYRVNRFGQLPWGPHSHLHFLPLTDHHASEFGQILTSWLENQLYQNHLESYISLNRDSRILPLGSINLVGLGWGLGNLCLKKIFPQVQTVQSFWLSIRIENACTHTQKMHAPFETQQSHPLLRTCLWNFIKIHGNGCSLHCYL